MFLFLKGPCKPVDGPIADQISTIGASENRVSSRCNGKGLCFVSLIMFKKLSNLITYFSFLAIFEK